MATTGISNPATFTGSSSFSAQLQQVIANAVSRASAPVQQLQTEQTNLTAQQTELQTVLSNFGSIQSAIDSLNSATGLGSYSSTVSDPSVLSASISSGVMAGTYNLNVTGTGTQTNTISPSGLITVSDPSAGNLDTSSSYTLSVNGQEFQIDDQAGSLNGLAQAITNSGANVQATVVNVGSSSSPDYRLSVQSLDYAPDTIQLSDGTTNLLSTLSTGSYVTYQVNGQPSTPITSNSRTVNVSPGLSIQILQTGTASVTVGQSTSNIANSLTEFASAYNAVVNELDKNRGQNGGALTGQSIVYELQNQLQALASYSSASGGTSSLASLGLTFDQNGNLQFDSSAFQNATSTSIAGVISFLGSPTSGGFLQAATDALTQITDPTTGTLTQATQSIGNELLDVGTRISNDEAQVTQLQQSLTAQMASADAAISSLEQQVTEISSLFYDMQTNARTSSG